MTGILQKITNFKAAGTALGFLLLLSACSPDNISVSTGSREAPVNKAKTAEVIDVEKTCGLKAAAEGEEDDRVVFTQYLQSLPIVITGTQMGAKYRVTTQAHLQIETRNESGTQQNLQVEVKKVETSASNIFVQMIAPSVAKSKATKSAQKLSGPKQTVSLPNGQWLNLVTAGGEYKDLFCAIRASKTVTDNSGEDTAIVEYSPALPNSINPLAPRETLEREIGQGRTFNVRGKITKTKEGYPAMGDYDVVVQITPRSPSFTLGDGTSVSSDIAYDVIVTFKDGGSAASPLSSKQSFFINTTNKNFDAIVDSSDRVVDGTKAPPTILLKQ